jgi:stage II sporulation protein AA (anti-sigma F factor antagonist)
MNVEVRQVGDTLVLKPEGAINSATAGALQEPLLKAIGDHHGPVELDFSAVNYISSAGLRVLVLASKEIKASDMRLRLTHVAPGPLQILQLANFGSFLDIEPAGS